MYSVSRTPRRKKEQSTPTQRRRSATERQRLLTGAQVEELFGLPYRSLYDLVMRGVVTPVRFPSSRRLWFERAAIESLISSSRETR